MNGDKVGGEPTEDDKFWCGVGDDLLKRSLPFLNDVLRQLVTLSVALVGGSIAVLNDGQIDARFKLAAVAAFLLALFVSLVGIVPIRGNFRRNSASEIEDTVLRGERWKSRLIWVSAGLIVAGLLVVFRGLLVRHFG